MAEKPREKLLQMETKYKWQGPKQGWQLSEKEEMY